MSVSVVAVSSLIYNASGTSVVITTPAGSIGDLVVFFMTHDTYASGAFTPSSPPITITTIHDGSPQLSDNSRQAIFWGIEDQAAGRDFTFTFTSAQEFGAVCIRFSGHDGSTPIQSGSLARKEGRAFAPTAANNLGDMFVGFVGADTLLVSPTAPEDWTERFDGGGTGVGLYGATKPADTYPFPEQHTSLDTSEGAYTGYGFVINNGAAGFTIEGVTKDKDGSVLVSCEVALFKATGDTPPLYYWVASTTSDGSTGAYSFTVFENPSMFMVYSIKDDTPHVFDATDNVLTPS